MVTPTKTCEKGVDPKTCSPEQIKECHGDTATHPCETSGNPKKK